MRKVLVFLLLLTVSAFADNINPADTITLVGRSILSNGENAQPDSLRLITFFKSSAVCSSWYNETDADCFSAANALIVYDIFSDLDGSGGDGHYTVEIGAYGGGEAIFTYWYYDFTVGGFPDSVYGKGGLIDTTKSTKNVEADSYTPDVNVVSADNDAIEDADIATIEVNIKGSDTIAVVTAVDDKTEYALTTAEKQTIGGLAKDSTWFAEWPDTVSEILSDSVREALKLDLATLGNMAETTWTHQTRQLTSSQTFDLTGDITGNLSGNVGGNVTGSVGSISGITFPTNFGDLGITVTTGRVSVGTNYDKTGYSLSQSFPANFADLAITATTGLVDINDKTGFSLTTQDWTTDGDITQLKTDLSSDHGSGSWETATDVNVTQISGSPAAADSAEKTFLGTLADYSDYHSNGDTIQRNASTLTMTDINGRDAIGDTIQRNASTHSPIEIWYNIDTSASIDTSDIGDWMIDNLSGGSTPAAIADAVWDEDTTGHATAGTMGKKLDIAADTSLLATIDDMTDSTRTVFGDSLRPALGDSCTGGGTGTCAVSGLHLFGVSEAGQPAIISFQHTEKCDSVWMYLYYPDYTTVYDSISLSPDTLNLLSDSLVWTTTVADTIDSVGVNMVMIYYRESADSDTGYVAGLWKVEYEWFNPAEESLYVKGGKLDEVDSTKNIGDKEGYLLSSAGNEAVADSVLKDSTHYQGAGGATAQQIWEYGTRTLTAFNFNVILAQNGLDNDTSFTQLQDLVNTNLDVVLSTRSTFDHTSNKVTVVDSSASDISYVANNPNDYKASGFAEPGDAMALTPGERQASADTNEARLDLSDKTIGTATDITNAVDINSNADITAIKSKTDSLDFNDSSYVNVNIKTTNDTTIQDSSGRIYVAGDVGSDCPTLSQITDAILLETNYYNEDKFGGIFGSGIQNGNFGYGEAEVEPPSFWTYSEGGQNQDVSTAYRDSINADQWNTDARGYGCALIIVGDSGTVALSANKYYRHPGQYIYGGHAKATGKGEFHIQKYRAGDDDTLLYQLDITDTTLTWGYYADTVTISEAGLYMLTITQNCYCDTSEGTDSIFIDNVFLYRLEDTKYYANIISESVYGFTDNDNRLARFGDSTEFQGEAGNAEGIAHAVAETLITGRGLATFGNGQYACTLFVLDKSDSSAIVNVWVTVRPVNGSEILARFQTLTEGSGIANLNAGDHAVSLFNPNYVFNQIDTVTISGSQTDTLWGTLFAPSPQAPYLCQVWGTIISPDTLSGTTVKAVLVDSSGNKFKSSNPPRIGNTLITRFEFSAETTTSIWQISLIPNDDITPANTKWEFEIKYPDGTLLKLKAAVPKQASYEFQW